LTKKLKPVAIDPLSNGDSGFSALYFPHLFLFSCQRTEISESP
jgi:hypothetical protein